MVDRIAGLEQGVDDYITKPFSATYLKTRIASLLRQRKSLQEIYMAKLTEGKKIAVAEALTPSQPQITPYDEQFMQKVMEFIEEQMDNAELTIDEFAEHLMLSRTIFYRKLKSIIGLTPVDFIREVRIKRAAQLIDSGEYNFSQVAYMTGFNDLGYFIMILAGSGIGFLFFNYHPAKIFMGDTGSLALGGAIAGICVMSRTELLLIFLGLIFVLEALSVIIQVASFQLTGKRVFKMSPLHHHFELSGWSEVHVVWAFWIFEGIAACVSLLLAIRAL